MMGGKSWDKWIEEYSEGHQHPVNRWTHAVGIPMILISVLLFAVSLFVEGVWPIALGLFIFGWILQFVGHYFEGKPPEFFKDWRFLFVGLRGGLGSFLFKGPATIRLAPLGPASTVGASAEGEPVGVFLHLFRIEKGCQAPINLAGVTFR